MSYGKFFVGLIFLAAAVAQLPAQWGPNPMDRDIMGRGMGGCQDMLIRVQDNAGMGIIGASVTTDTNYVQVTTDSRGMAVIPCRSSNTTFTNIEVSAPGFQTARTPMMADGGSMEVRLEKQQPVIRAQERTVSARELSPSVQAESQELQKQAGKAMDAKDYGTAEDLLLKAEKLTPSAAFVLNNLGVCALHKNDLDSAGSWFEKAAQAAPFKPEIVGNLGLVRWMQHRGDESYTLLSKATSMGYETGLAHYILGTLGLEKGMAKEAAEHLKKVPTDRFPYRDLYLSLALRNTGKTKAADESYRNFLKQHPAPFAISILSKISG